MQPNVTSSRDDSMDLSPVLAPHRKTSANPV
jgi:hypothetical protein